MGKQKWYQVGKWELDSTLLLSWLAVWPCVTPWPSLSLGATLGGSPALFSIDILWGCMGVPRWRYWDEWLPWLRGRRRDFRPHPWSLMNHSKGKQSCALLASLTYITPAYPILPPSYPGHIGSSWSGDLVYPSQVIFNTISVRQKVISWMGEQSELTQGWATLGLRPHPRKWTIL